MTKTGEVDQIFSHDELDKIVLVMSKLPLSDGRNDQENYRAVRGIGPAHGLYQWFVKKYFVKIQDYFTNPKLKLTMVKYNDSAEPEKLHSDYYTSNGHGISFKTLLIPVGVNGQSHSLDKDCVHTIIFNEADQCIDRDGYWSDRDWLKQRQIKSNNSLQYKDQYLSHLKHEDLECLSIDRIWKWKYGSMVHWDEDLLHCSDNFTKNNIRSKQAIVMHTHVL